MRKIWRKAEIPSRIRRKKHVTKQNLRNVKKEFALFERSCEDTKDLWDIPKEALMLPPVDLDALLSEKLAYLGQLDLC